MTRIALLAPLSAIAIESTFPDAEVVAVQDGVDPVEAATGADVCIADWTATHRVAGDVIAALAGTCRLVQVPAAGVDSVDVAACADAGIPVAACGGLNAVAVAEWCVFGAIAALRDLSAGDRSMREGRFEQLGHTRYELAGKTVGIVGMGDIGRAAVPRFRAFDTDVAYWSRTQRPAEVETELGMRYLPLDDLIIDSDVLVLVVALTPDTRHLLDADRIASMKPSAVVVNAARGGIVDEMALTRALAEQRIHGAAIDVYSQEPPPEDHPLLDAPRSVFTPHVAGATVESVGRILQRSLSNVQAVLDGDQPEGLIDV